MFTVEAKVSDGVITSSPGPISRAARRSCIAAVPEVKETARAAPVSSWKDCSNSRHTGPVVIHPERRHRVTAAISSPPRAGLLKGKKSGRIFMLTAAFPEG